MVVLTGCNLQLEVAIDVEEDGSGLVTAGLGLDAEANDRYPNAADLLVTSDLVEAGWEIELPDGPAADGRRWVRASKPFSNPSELQAVLDELTGPDGAFRNFEISRDNDAVKSTFRVTGDVDLTDGLDTFTDDELSALLEDPPLGVDRATLEAEIGTTLEEAVSVRVVVRVPGNGDGETVEVALGDQAAVDASATEENRAAQLLGWVRLALLALLGLSLVLAAVNWLLDRRYERLQPQRRPTSVASRVPGSDPAVAAAAAAPRPAPLQLLVLDVHNVLFRQASEPEDRLIPFIREHGGAAGDDEIAELHREGTLGRLTSAEFWERVGVVGTAANLDAEYVSGFRLQSGAKEFLREMHRRGMPIAVISNDFAEWSYALRDLHGMQGMQPWIVSAEVGVRKPDPAAFEAIRRLTGLPYQSCLVVDGRIPSLDTAKTLGMMTAWFTRVPPEADAEVGHSVVTRFSDFFRRRK